LAGTAPNPLTQADLLPNAIGDDPCVADHVRSAKYSDRADAPERGCGSFAFLDS